MLAEDFTLECQLISIKNNSKTYVKQYVIQQLNKTGQLIAEYKKISECDLCKEDIAKASHISDCINGKRKTAYGYKWKRVEINCE